MASERFWLSSIAFTAVAPAISAGWNDQTPEVPANPRRELHATKGTSTQVDAQNQSIAGQFALLAQFVSEDLGEGLIFESGVTAVKCQILALEEIANDNVVAAMAIKVVSADGGTVRATLLSVQQTHGAEFNTSLRNKTFADGDLISASYTTVAGDRLVVEIGFTDSAGTNPRGIIAMGEDVGGSTTDLPENETATGGVAWIQFDNVEQAPPSDNPSAAYVSPGEGWF